MSGDPTRVFLDTNIVVALGRSPEPRILSWLNDLVKHRCISVLTTDVTCGEIVKKHAENEFKLIKSIADSRFRESIERFFGITLPDVGVRKLWKQLYANYEDDVTSMFQKLDAKVLTVDTVKPSEVFSDHSMKRGFFPDDAKKDQFPDAFVFECLKQEASNNGPVMIVSNDNDFDGPVSNETKLSLVKSLGAMLDEIGVETVPPDEQNSIEHYQEQLIEVVINYLWEREIERVNEDIEVNNVEVSQVEAQQTHCLRIRDDWNSVLARGLLKMNTKVSYADPAGLPPASGALEVEVLVSLGRAGDHDIGGLAELSFPNRLAHFVVLD